MAKLHQTGPSGPSPLYYDLISYPGYQKVASGSGYYDYVCHPTIAVEGLVLVSSAEGLTVVEVHQGSDPWGTLWYQVGTVVPNPAPGVADKASISWDRSYAFDTGGNPSVTFIDNQTVMEVHQDGPAPAGLWSSVGGLNGSTLQSSPSTPDAYGANPSVSAMAN